MVKEWQVTSVIRVLNMIGKYWDGWKHIVFTIIGTLIIYAGIINLFTWIIIKIVEKYAH